MGRPRKKADVLATFRVARVLTLEQLCDRLASSRATVLRRLKEHGYYSSYNHAGRYLTVKGVVDFDSQGLWVWKTARFSRQGTLKQTVHHFVQACERGMTHEELATLLGVRAHNTVLELVGEDRIRRERLGPTFVYLSRKPSVRRQQVLRRKSLLTEHQKTRPTSRQIIATLLELIKDPKADRHDIMLRCQRAAVAISRQLVDAIFDTYVLNTKRGP